MSKNQVMGVIGFGFAFIFLCVGGCEVWATEMTAGDTIQLAVEYKTAYPGRFVEISVWMTNPVPIQAFSLDFTLGGWDHLINFKTTDIYVDSTRVPLDTCADPYVVCTVDTCLYSGSDGCDTLHPDPDTCPCLVWNRFPVRECFIDTVGSLIRNFETVTCHGDPGDTNLPDCKRVVVYGKARQMGAIPPRGSPGLLFRLGVNLSCLCNADSGREVLFLVSQGFSSFSDSFGFTHPFKYDMGELFAWWGKNGDANSDSAANSADISFLINYLFVGGPKPCTPEAADPDSSCHINSADISYLINYLFVGGPQPKGGCACAIKKEE